MKTLVHRAKTVCDSESLEGEIKFLQDIFAANGYPRNCVEKARVSMTKRTADPKADQRLIFLPYYKGVSEKLSRFCRSLDLKPIMKPGRSLRDQLTKVKPLIEDKSNAIYKVDCSSCSQFYIGESGRRLSTRTKEHIRDIKTINYRSAIAEHVHEQQHQPCFPPKIVTTESNTRTRKIKEALYIRTNKYTTFNRDSGLELSDLWNPLIDKFKAQFKL